MRPSRSRGSRSSRGSRGGDAGDLVQLTTVVLNAFEAWKFGGRGERPDPLMEEARRNVWKLMRAYEKAADVGAGRDFLDEIRYLIGNPEDAKKAFVAWTELIESLIQSAEKAYGTGSKRGGIKRGQVKAAIIRLLLDTKNLRLPVPSYVQPFVIEAAVDWAIDTLVLTLNHNHLWVASNEQPKVHRNVFQQLFDRLGAWLLDGKPYTRFAAWLQSISVRIVLRGNPLEPDVRAAVDRIEKEEGGGITRSLRQLSQFTQWLVAHRQQAMALAVLVSAAAEDAEFFLALRTGAEKKEYARDSVIAFLEYVGIISSEDSLMYYLVDGALDWFIDAIVNIFNRRDPVFVYHKRDRLAR